MLLLCGFIVAFMSPVVAVVELLCVPGVLSVKVVECFTVMWVYLSSLQVVYEAQQIVVPGRICC